MSKKIQNYQCCTGVGGPVAAISAVLHDVVVQIQN